MDTIMQLNEASLNEVMRLFTNCFKSDHYYRDLYNKENFITDLCNDSINSILYCLQHGLCYGTYHNNELISFILTFNYNELKLDKQKFLKMFTGDENGELSYIYEIHHRVENLKEVTFILLIAVKEEYRHQGIASSLIDKLLSNCTTSIVSDVSNTASLPMYIKRGFKIYNIDTDYNLVIKQ